MACNEIHRLDRYTGQCSFHGVACGHQNQVGVGREILSTASEEMSRQPTLVAVQAGRVCFCLRTAIKTHAQYSSIREILGDLLMFNYDVPFARLLALADSRRPGESAGDWRHVALPVPPLSCNRKPHISFAGCGRPSRFSDSVFCRGGGVSGTLGTAAVQVCDKDEAGQRKERTPHWLHLCGR